MVKKKAQDDELDNAHVFSLWEREEIVNCVCDDLTNNSFLSIKIKKKKEPKFINFPSSFFSHSFAFYFFSQL